MRLIGTVSAEAPARRFCDFLLTRGIASHVEPASEAWQIWIENDDQIDAGRAELQQFAAAPNDARYDTAADANRIRADAQRAAVRRRKNFTDVRTASFTAGKTTPVTVTLIFTAVVLCALMKFGDTDSLFQNPDGPAARLYRVMLFNNPIHNAASTLPPRLHMFASIAGGQLWRLVTPIFIHYGPLHLLFNMMWMLDLGRRIEPAKGGVRLIAIVLVIAIISCCAEALWINNSPFGRASYGGFGGMSGVVAGLFGYAWMCGKYRPYEHIGVTEYETGLMLGWLVICSFGFIGPIANAAHWGGLVTGMALGAGPSYRKKLKR